MELLVKCVAELIDLYLGHRKWRDETHHPEFDKAGNPIAMDICLDGVEYLSFILYTHIIRHEEYKNADTLINKEYDKIKEKTDK